MFLLSFFSQCSNITFSLPSYTGSALKRELNFCNGYLSLLYFCLEACSSERPPVYTILSIENYFSKIAIIKAYYFWKKFRNSGHSAEQAMVMAFFWQLQTKQLAALHQFTTLTWKLKVFFIFMAQVKSFIVSSRYFALTFMIHIRPFNLHLDF